MAPCFIASITSSSGGWTAKTKSASATSSLRSAMNGDVLEVRVRQLDGVAGTCLHVQLGAKFDELGHD